MRIPAGAYGCALLDQLLTKEEQKQSIKEECEASVVLKWSQKSVWYSSTSSKFNLKMIIMDFQTVSNNARMAALTTIPSC